MANNEIDYSYQTMIPLIQNAWTSLVDPTGPGDDKSTYTNLTNDFIMSLAGGTFVQENLSLLQMTEEPPPSSSPPSSDTLKYNRTVVGKLFNLMLGITIQSATASGPNNDANFQFNSLKNNIQSIDMARSQRFFTFWNKVINATALGAAFTNFMPSDKLPTLSDRITSFRYRNILSTAVMVLLFEELSSSTDGTTQYPPLHIFIESNSPSFCQASENIRQFLSGAEGIGNFPIFSPAPNIAPDKQDEQITYINEHINRGYLKKFCNNVFKKEYPNEKVPSGNIQDYSDKSIQEYRTKISRSENALAWCGCFSPIPSWAYTVYTEKTDSTPNVETNRDFPNACDNLCHSLSDLTIIRPTQAPFVLDKQTNPGQPIACKSTICVIDDNVINAVNSTGNIYFYQICPKSSGSITKCYLDVTNPGILDNVRSANGNGMLTQELFLQDCPDAVCYVLDDKNMEQKIVPCNKINTPSTGGLFRKNDNGLSGVKKYEKIYGAFWDFVLTIIFLLILFEFAYVEIHRYMQRSKLL